MAYLFWVVWDADVPVVVDVVSMGVGVWDVWVTDVVSVDSVGSIVSIGPGQLSPTLNFLAGAYMLEDVWFVWLACVDVLDADVWDADVWDADVPVVVDVVSMGVSLTGQVMISKGDFFGN